MIRSAPEFRISGYRSRSIERLPVRIKTGTINGTIAETGIIARTGNENENEIEIGIGIGIGIRIRIRIENGNGNGNGNV